MIIRSADKETERLLGVGCRGLDEREGHRLRFPGVEDRTCVCDRVRVGPLGAGR